MELGRSLVGDLDLELMLKRVLEAGRELTGAASSRQLVKGVARRAGGH